MKRKISETEKYSFRKGFIFDRQKIVWPLKTEKFVCLLFKKSSFEYELIYDKFTDCLLYVLRKYHNFNHRHYYIWEKKHDEVKKSIFCILVDYQNWRLYFTHTGSSHQKML